MCLSPVICWIHDCICDWVIYYVYDKRVRGRVWLRRNSVPGLNSKLHSFFLQEHHFILHIIVKNNLEYHAFLTFSIASICSLTVLSNKFQPFYIIKNAINIFIKSVFLKKHYKKYTQCSKLKMKLKVQKV